MTKQQIIDNYISFHLGNIKKSSEKIPYTNINIWEGDDGRRFFVPISQRLYFEEKEFVAISLMLFLNYEDTEKHIKNWIRQNFKIAFSNENINLF